MQLKKNICWPLTCKYSGLEGRERLASDLSEASADCIATLEVILDFLQPLVDQTARLEKADDGRDICRQRREQCRVLRSFLLRACERPLAFLHQVRLYYLCLKNMGRQYLRYSFSAYPVILVITGYKIVRFIKNSARYNHFARFIGRRPFFLYFFYLHKVILPYIRSVFWIHWSRLRIRIQALPYHRK